MNMNKESLVFIGSTLVVVAGVMLMSMYFLNRDSSIDNTQLLGVDSQQDPINFKEEEDTDMNNIEDFSELEIKVIQEGTGEQAKAGDKVVVNYEGTLSDGTKFDSSYDNGAPFSFDLGAGGVIQGWEEGVSGMKVGEIRELKIPSSMGYGTAGAGGIIPPNAGLIFKVELLEIQ